MSSSAMFLYKPLKETSWGQGDSSTKWNGWRKKQHLICLNLIQSYHLLVFISIIEVEFLGESLCWLLTHYVKQKPLVCLINLIESYNLLVFISIIECNFLGESLCWLLTHYVKQKPLVCLINLIESYNLLVFISIIEGKYFVVIVLRQILQINGENVAGFTEHKVHDIFKKAGVNNIVLAVRDRSDNKQPLFQFFVKDIN